MKRYLVYFFHGSEHYFAFECDESEVESRTRYWLGKSPGSYPNRPVQITAFPMEAAWQLTGIIDWMDAEERQREEKSQELRDRAEFERLKKRFA